MTYQNILSEMFDITQRLIHARIVVLTLEFTGTGISRDVGFTTCWFGGYAEGNETEGLIA